MRKRSVILLVVILALLVVGGGWLWLRTHDRQKNHEAGNQTVNYAKPGKSEQNAAESSKDTAPDATSPSTSQRSGSGTKKKVSVVITTYNDHDNGNLSVNGYVDGVVESGGTCKLTLRDTNGKDVSTTRLAQPDATTTTCGESIIPLSKLHTGTWQAILSYSSPTASGTTAATDPRNQIEIN